MDKRPFMFVAILCLPAVAYLFESVGALISGPRDLATVEVVIDEPQEANPSSVQRPAMSAPVVRRDSTTGPYTSADTPVDSASVQLLSDTTSAVLLVGDVAPAEPLWNWVRRMSGTPPARSGHALAYSAERRGVLMFGGRSADGLRGDTWIWNRNGWAEISLETAPAPRSDLGLAYGDVAKQVVLFGGRSADVLLGDTWVWDGEEWMVQSPAASPPARFGHAMAYDAARDRIVLFGGRGVDGAPLNDTWEWDGGSWERRLVVTPPRARAGHAMAYDGQRGTLVLFGGTAATDSSGLLNDTWEWNGTTWTELATKVAPVPRANHALAFDPAENRLVLFGGVSGDMLADTWQWNGSEWAKLDTVDAPAGRRSAAMVFDGSRGRLVMYGGERANEFADTWEFRTP